MPSACFLLNIGGCRECLFSGCSRTAGLFPLETTPIRARFPCRNTQNLSIRHRYIIEYAKSRHYIHLNASHILCAYCGRVD